MDKTLQEEAREAAMQPTRGGVDVPVFPPRDDTFDPLAQLDPDEDPIWFHVVSPREQNGALGPFTTFRMREKFAENDIAVNTLVWREGLPSWAAIKDLPELRYRLIDIPPMPKKKRAKRDVGAHGHIHNALVVKERLDGIRVTDISDMEVHRMCSHCGCPADVEVHEPNLHRHLPPRLRESIGSTRESSEIIPGFVWLGNAAACRERAVRNIGATVVINCTADIPNALEAEEGMLYLRLSMVDQNAPDPGSDTSHVFKKESRSDSMRRMLSRRASSRTSDSDREDADSPRKERSMSPTKQPSESDSGSVSGGTPRTASQSPDPLARPLSAEAVPGHDSNAAESESGNRSPSPRKKHRGALGIRTLAKAATLMSRDIDIGGLGLDVEDDDTDGFDDPDDPLFPNDIRDMVKAFDKAHGTIVRYKDDPNKRILVHSRTGNDRGAAVLIAHLIHDEGWTVEEAFRHVKRCRGPIKLTERHKTALNFYSRLHARGNFLCTDCYRARFVEPDNRLQWGVVENAQALIENPQDTTADAVRDRIDLRGEQAAERIVKHVAVPGLNDTRSILEMNLSGNKLGPTEMQELATSLSDNASLQRLSLSFNRIGDEGVHALCESIWSGGCRNLQALFLSSNGIGPDGGRAIGFMLRLNTSLLALDLSGNDLGDDGSGYIFTAMTEYQGLKKVSDDQAAKRRKSNFAQQTAEKAAAEASDNASGQQADGDASPDEGVEDLEEIVRAIEAEEDRLAAEAAAEEAALRDDAFEAEASVISSVASCDVRKMFNKHLTQLDVSCNGIAQKGTSKLVDVFESNQVLSRLCLDQTPSFGATEFKHLCSFLKLYNKSLVHLSLNDCNLGSDGARSLGRALRSVRMPLEFLSVSDNGILSGGIKRIADALSEHRFIRRVDVSRNPIGNHGAEHMASVIRHSALVALDVSYCSITDAGAVAIAQAVGARDKPIHHHHHHHHESGDQQHSNTHPSTAEGEAGDGDASVGGSHAGSRRTGDREAPGTPRAPETSTVPSADNAEEATTAVIDATTGEELTPEDDSVSPPRESVPTGAQEHNEDRPEEADVPETTSPPARDGAATGPTAEASVMGLDSVGGTRAEASESIVLMASLTSWVEGARDNGLHELLISHNKIGPDGGEALGIMLAESPSLHVLHAQDCRLSLRGVRCIMRALYENTTLHVLNLSGNHFRDAGAHELAEMMKRNTTIRFVDAGFNEITDEAMQAVLAAVHTTSTSTREQRVMELHLNLHGNDTMTDYPVEPGLARSKQQWRFFSQDARDVSQWTQPHPGVVVNRLKQLELTANNRVL